MPVYPASSYNVSAARSRSSMRSRLTVLRSTYRQVADSVKYQPSGKLTVNDVPLVSSELTDTRPPCALTISLTINKPRPTLRTPFSASAPRVIGRTTELPGWLVFQQRKQFLEPVIRNSFSERITVHPHLGRRSCWFISSCHGVLVVKGCARIARLRLSPAVPL